MEILIDGGSEKTKPNEANSLACHSCGNRNPGSMILDSASKPALSVAERVRNDRAVNPKCDRSTLQTDRVDSCSFVVNLKKQTQFGGGENQRKVSNNRGL